MSNKEQIYSFFLLGILAVSLYAAFLVLQPFLHNIFIAVILATLLHPAHLWVKRRMGQRDTLAALCSTALVTVCILVPMFLFMAALVNQAAGSITALQTWLRGAHLETWIKGQSIAPYIQWVQDTFPWLDVDLTKLDVKGGLLDLSKNVGQVSIDLGTRLLGNFVGLLLNFLIMLFVLFFLFRDGVNMLVQLKHLSPLHEAQEDRILRKMRDVAYSVVAGSFLVAICQGVVGGIGLAIVGIPAFFWGAMMGFASLVPVVGTLAIWGPAAIYLLIIGDWKGALIITAWGAIIVSSIDSVLRPLVMQGQAQMSTFWVFLSIIGGIKYFGPLGILYGPMILALAMVMLAIYSDEYNDMLTSKCYQAQDGPPMEDGKDIKE